MRTAFKSGIFKCVTCQELCAEPDALEQARAERDKLKAQRDALLAAAEEVLELIEGYVDIKDGENGPLPNNAMRATQVLDAAIKGAQ